jgi:hypothetical protein
MESLNVVPPTPQGRSVLAPPPEDQEELEQNLACAEVEPPTGTPEPEDAGVRNLVVPAPAEGAPGYHRAGTTPDHASAPTIADLINSLRQFDPGPCIGSSEGCGLDAEQICDTVALGVVRTLSARGDDAVPGYDLTSRAIWEADPKLKGLFRLPNPIGNYVGNKGLRTGNPRDSATPIQLGPCLGVRPITSHSPHRWPCCRDTVAAAALRRLRDRGFDLDQVASQIGLADQAELAGKLGRFPTLDQYLAQYGNRGNPQPKRRHRRQMSG